ncbi:MAG: serine O-acetyltransferase, partial [Verrucomicrobiota bacterium]
MAINPEAAAVPECRVETSDPLWQDIRAEASALVEREPALVELTSEVVLKRVSLEEALSVRLSRKLHLHATPVDYLKNTFCQIFKAHPGLGAQVRADIRAVQERDPACQSHLHVVLFYKGFLAITTHRIAHQLWNNNRREFALYLQSLASEVFGVDIHPAARFGSGIFLDHATSFVAGETAEVADNVSILHEVTLGGTGKERGDRHPKIGSG